MASFLLVPTCAKTSHSKDSFRFPDRFPTVTLFQAHRAAMSAPARLMSRDSSLAHPVNSGLLRRTTARYESAPVVAAITNHGNPHVHSRRSGAKATTKMAAT